MRNGVKNGQAKIFLRLRSCDSSELFKMYKTFGSRWELYKQAILLVLYVARRLIYNVLHYIKCVIWPYNNCSNKLRNPLHCMTLRFYCWLL